MLSQTVLNFKLESTGEKITARGGLPLYVEFFKSMNVPELLERNLPKPRGNHAYDADKHVLALSMMMYAGGEAIEHLRELREDEALLKLLDSLVKIPSSSATGKWLAKAGARGAIRGLEQVNKEIVQKMLINAGITEVTVVWDPTMIKANKRDAKMSYLGYKGLQARCSLYPRVGLCTRL